MMTKGGFWVPPPGHQQPLSCADQAVSAAWHGETCCKVKLPCAQAPEVLMGGKCGSKVDIFRSALVFGVSSAAQSSDVCAAPVLDDDFCAAC